MVEHIVLLKPKAEATQAQIDELWTRLHALKATIPGIASIVSGANSSPEGIDRGYSLGFIVTFERTEDRDGYLPHPDHMAVVPYVHAVAETVLVVDLER